MRRQLITSATAVALFAGVSPVIGAAAVPTATHDGAWTTVTAPAGPGQVFAYEDNNTTPTPFDVKGTLSPNTTATSVDIVCSFRQDRSVAFLAADVPVTNRAFNKTIATFIYQPCVLRAVPHGEVTDTTDNEAYLAGFTGPRVFPGRNIPEVNSDFQYDRSLPHALIQLHSAGDAGVIGLRPFDVPTESYEGVDEELQLLGLTGTNDYMSPTNSSLIVDGRTAYLPTPAKVSANNPNQVPGTKVQVKRAKDGGFLLVETSDVLRCATPTPYSQSSKCDMAESGVRVVRTVASAANGGLFYVLDRFSSTDKHSHVVKASYQNYLPLVYEGTPTLAVPPAKSASKLPDKKTYPALPRGAHTIRYTFDSRSPDGDSQHQVIGLVYGGRPSVKESITSLWGTYQLLVLPLTYTRTIPAHGSVGIAHALSTSVSSTALRAQTRRAEVALTGHLMVTSPKSGIKVHHDMVRVSGKVVDLANGLPATVRVSDGSHHATAAVKPSGRWSAVVAVPRGRSRISATATDPGGNPLHDSVSVKR